jgi:hypothetical protein
MAKRLSSVSTALYPVIMCCAAVIRVTIFPLVLHFSGTGSVVFAIWSFIVAAGLGTGEAVVATAAYVHPGVAAWIQVNRARKPQDLYRLGGNLESLQTSLLP